MAKYKNSVADIELPNIKTWNSESLLKVRVSQKSVKSQSKVSQKSVKSQSKGQSKVSQKCQSRIYQQSTVILRFTLVLILQDDQEALIDTKLSLSMAGIRDSKTDLKKSRPSSLKISDSTAATETSEEENESLSFQDIKQCCPTCIILLITVVIMVTVIPYAFSNVIK